MPGNDGAFPQPTSDKIREDLSDIRNSSRRPPVPMAIALKFSRENSVFLKLELIFLSKK